MDAMDKKVEERKRYMDTRNKTVVVTGGAQGIGKAVCQAFCRKGYSVVFCDIDTEAGEETSRELCAHGEALYLPADVSREDDVAFLIETAAGHYGTIDILVNNAGLMIRKPLMRLSLSEWSRVIDTNLSSIFLCSRYALSHLKAARGSIINIASTRALMSEPDTESYAASKGGIVALTHALAISCGPDVRVNCISPGWIEVSEWKKKSTRITPELTPHDHNQHPSGRVGRPEDIARAVLYLSDSENGFITGTNLVIDGGMTRKMIYEE